ncbi:MAG: pyridoxamine 5'-phosphate oxidase family protein [Chloroflexi bacterium]|nr:pyridoxamine 5'-phosphate oxidase family protein [Chloroflexota bacterium]
MFREMRRKKQLLSDAETIKILNTATSGTLALSGDNGYPYAVPLSFVYQDGSIYFHIAREGHKVDSIRRSDKASFCVIDKDEVITQELTTLYRSVIVFGRIRLLEDVAAIKSALQYLGDKYSPGYTERTQQAIARELKNLAIAELAIEHMTGKQAIELVPAKADNE